MLTSITASSTPVKRLKIGERGVISRIKGANPIVLDRMRRLGLFPGTSIRLEQRFPSFVVRTCKGSLPLSQAMIEAINVST